MNKYILVTMLFLVSCGQSPLFNHKMEKSSQEAQSFFGQQGDVLQFGKTNFSFGLDWQMGPTLGESKFILRAWDESLGTSQGPYQDLPNTLHIFLWMPSMGHGSAPVKITKLGVGEYLVSNIYFIMGGDWEIKIQLKKDSKVIDETVISLNL